MYGRCMRFKLMILMLLLMACVSVAQRPGPVACPTKTNWSCEAKPGVPPSSFLAFRNFRTSMISWACDGPNVVHTAPCDIAWLSQCCIDGGPNACPTAQCPCNVAE